METTTDRKDMKPELRRFFLGLRCSLDERQRSKWDRKISQHIEHYFQTRSPSTLGIYFPTRNEPDLTKLYVRLAEKGFSLSLPVVMDKRAPLRFAQWEPGDPLIKDSYGISTPEIRQFVPLPQTLLIPCLGFTSDRYRLGYGGGYFDRTLEQDPRPHTIGVAYACLKTAFPSQEYDVPLDCIVTETGII
jgi:5,10-methenyltetrahydrofolate synthetase